MGFLSKIFGGGGSSTSATSSSTNVTVNPVTSIEFDLDKLAQAMQEGNAGELLTESAKISILAREQEINAEQTALTENTIKSLQSFIPLITVSAIYLIFIKKKRSK